MIKTITNYQSLTLSMIRVPKFQQAVEDNIHMVYRNESTKRKNMFQGKKLFSGEGVWSFVKFQGGIDQLVKSTLAFTHPLCSIYIASQQQHKIANFFMLNNFSVDQVGLYINWANISLCIILGKLPTLNLPIKSHPSLMWPQCRPPRPPPFCRGGLKILQHS